MTAEGSAPKRPPRRVAPPVSGAGDAPPRRRRPPRRPQHGGPRGGAEPGGADHDGQSADEQEGSGGVAYGVPPGPCHERPPRDTGPPQRSRAQQRGRRPDQCEHPDGPDQRTARQPGPYGPQVGPHDGDGRPPGEPDEPAAAHRRPEVGCELPPPALLVGQMAAQVPGPRRQRGGVGDERKRGQRDPDAGQQALGEEREPPQALDPVRACGIVSSLSPSVRRSPCRR